MAGRNRVKLYEKSAAPLWTMKDWLWTTVLFLGGLGLFSFADAPSKMKPVCLFLIFAVCYLTGQVNAHRRVIKGLGERLDRLNEELATKGKADDLTDHPK